MSTTILSNFTSGVWSPALRGRVDLAKYYNACEMLENMITRPHGPAFTRPGTYYVTEVIGREHVTNGAFASDTGWTKGAGWTISGGKAVGAAGTTSDIYQDPGNLVEGEVYEFIFTLSDRTAGSVRPKIGGTSGTVRTPDGTYTERITCGATTIIAIEKSSDFDGKIDDVSVRRVAPKARLESFEFSTLQAYILEFTDLNLRIYKDNGIITDGGVIVEVTTPYTEADLFELQMTQSADTMYVAHSSYKPQKLERTSHVEWTLTDIAFIDGPFEESEETTAIAPSAVSGSITLTSTDAIFLTTDIDRLVRLESVGVAEWESGTEYAVNDYVTYDGEDFVCIKTVPVAGKSTSNKLYWKQTGRARWYWLKITAVTSTTEVTATVGKDALPNTTSAVNYCLGTWNSVHGYPLCAEFYEERLLWAGSPEYPQTVWASQSSDYENMGTGTIDSDAFIYTIAAKGVNPIQWMVPQNVLLIGTKGGEWRMGSSSTEDPLSVSNVVVKRQSTWGSANIQALLVNDVVLFVQRAGTKIRELAEDPTSISTKYVAPDLTILAEHITKGGIVDMAYQQEPQAILWCIRADGYLLGMTYERTQDVIGWHLHFTYGGDDCFESVAKIFGTKEDQVWTVVQRTIGGEVKRYVEYFKPWAWGDNVKDCLFVDSGLTYDGGDAVNITGATAANPVVITAAAHGFVNGNHVRILDVEEMKELNENVYVVADKTTNTFELNDDDGNNIDGTSFTAYVSGGTVQKVAKSYSGLDHLEGRAVSILADGCHFPDCTVEDGEITIDQYANKVHAGLGYTSKLKPMNLEAGQREGTAQGKTKKISKVTVRLQDTMSCKMGTCEDDLEEVKNRSDSDPADVPVPLFTGDKNINAFPGGYNTDGSILIVNDAPLPMTVVAIIADLRTYSG